MDEHIRKLVFPDFFADLDEERRSIADLREAWNSNVQTQIEELGISGSTGERFGAYLALARIRHHAAVPYFVDRLDDELKRASSKSGDACGCLCGIFHDLGAKEAARALERVLQTAPCGSTRHSAAGALGTCGDRETIEVLENTVRNDVGTDYEGRPVAGAAREAISKLTSRLAET